MSKEDEFSDMLGCFVGILAGFLMLVAFRGEYLMARSIFGDTTLASKQ